MENIFIFLLNNSITAGYVVLAVLLLRPLLKKAPKYIRCILWSFVGLRLILPFSVESILSLIPSAEPIPQEILYEAEPTVHTGISFMNSAINPVLSESMAPNPGDSVNPLQVVTAIAWNVWLLGVLVLVIYAFVSYIRLRRKLREAVKEEDRIYLCDRIPSPFLLGIFRPRIYLPSALPDTDRDYVIAHEKAHIRRKDHWWKPLGFLLLTVYWFNPLMWVGYIFLCRDIEFACDEKVLRELGADCKAAYSETLIRCSVSKKSISACPVAFGEEGVKGRIKSILNYKKPAFWIILISLLVCTAVAVCFLTNPKNNDDNLPQQSQTVYSFQAEILEVREDSLLVAPLDGDGLSIADKIIVRFPEGHTGTYIVGEQIAVSFDGMVEELYPPILPNVYGIFNTKYLSSYIGSSDLQESYNELKKGATFDIDGDGIVENVFVTPGPTSGLFSITLTATENGIPEYRNTFTTEWFEYELRTEPDGSVVLAGTGNNDKEIVLKIGAENDNIVLSGNADFVYWGGTDSNTLSQVRKNYPQYLNLSTDKGLEVYVWQNGAWRCGVRSGTNRNAELSELQAFGEGVALEEMAIILGTYGIPKEEITVLYSYNPAFSGKNPTLPTEQQQTYVEEILSAYLPVRISLQPYSPPEYPVQDTYPLVICAYPIAENSWRFRFYKKTTISDATGDALFQLGEIDTETAKAKLTEYSIPPEDIPVIVVQSYLSSYYQDITEQSVADVRTALGLS